MISCSILTLLFLGNTHIYLRIFESLLQVVIDSLIRDLADQGKIRYANLLLLCTFKYRFFDIWFATTAASRSLLGCNVFFAPGTFRDTLGGSISGQSG